MKKILSFMSLTLLVAGCADRTMPVADLPEIDTSNPLLAEWETPYATPPFERIELKDYEPAFDAAIAVQRAEIEAIVKNPAKPSFHNTIVALERSGELLSRIEGLFYNLLEADSNDEMQRIALARAILKDAPIVVLDEASSFADPENEAKIQKAFEALMKGKTVLMIAHRLSTVRNMDRILVIRDGEIAEEGKHDELLEKGGVYAAMWEEYQKAAQWKVGGAA